ncbi:hypothetical protein L3X38_002460 [Prunus dulcis]|uniref:Uncharacterized protein n=1 Tax=Prunus dulcis TaxID=3755 RepID=A0AAD4WWU6_PRUDU|nr:hypothetical protein L3X38_002460 [Prunus dulcis]
MQFLMGLNESYSAIRGQILLMQTLPTVRRTYSLIMQEEKQRELGSSYVTLELAAMADLATRTTIGLGKQRDGLYYLAALASYKKQSSGGRGEMRDRGGE